MKCGCSTLDCSNLTSYKYLLRSDYCLQIRMTSVTLILITMNGIAGNKKQNATKRLLKVSQNFKRPSILSDVTARGAFVNFG